MSKNQSGSFVTLEYPISSDDLHKKLFEAVTLYGFKERDKIYLTMSSQPERNRRVFFNNYTVGDGSNILIGIYRYANFWTPPASASAFAAALAERIKKFEEE